ncbi:hypothetical protein EHS25_009779 [Saitozyma podzolica]|uniref:Origin recognition complex subunit 4 n=1 Tax=Saitozyma podzolica TaxID=1890683 RepID=A0A427YK85_9TREE|nr:hypothetical protein EHS25_009779 [Saitozyma podzolica]
MSDPRKRRKTSPDPLTLEDIGGDAHEMGDVIVASASIPPSASGSGRKRAQPLSSRPVTPTTKRQRKTATTVVELPKASPKRNGAAVESESASSPANATSSAKKARTPRKQPATPTKRATPQVSQGKDGKTSTPRSRKTTTTPRASASASRPRATLGSSVSKTLPTPSPRKRGPAAQSTDPMPNFDEAFDEPNGTSSFGGGASSSTTGAGAAPAGEAFSRETFLTNEALRRQREARNFVYKGDVDAPKLTRSGRVVRTREDEGEVDEYGGVESSEVVGEEIGEEDRMEGDNERRGDHPSPFKSDLHSTRKGKSVAPPCWRETTCLTDPLDAYRPSRGFQPPAFDDEASNEALQSLVNLLKGTVERGEGNSALIVGPRGVGKTRTVARALSLIPSGSKTSPIIVRLSGHAQTNDRLAIREMGRQIADAEGIRSSDADDDAQDEPNEDEEYAPTTLPSHLLALLTAPSPRAIIIIIEEFDMFTEHARQALLYCLLDVVQSVKTGPVETTGRGVAVIGVTSRTDTLLLLEKRVKSRFSHRVLRVGSPLSPDGRGWKDLMRKVLVPWEPSGRTANAVPSAIKAESKETRKWMIDWSFAVDMLLEHEKVVRYLDRLCGLTTDVRNLYRPFIVPISEIIAGQLDFLSIPGMADSVLKQVDGAGWGLANAKLKGLSHPALGVLIVAKHLSYAGRDEFNFAQVEEEYLRFSRTKLVGSGRTRWAIGVLKTAFDHLARLGLLASTSSATVKPQFAKVRCTLAPHEIVGWFKGEGANTLGPELGNWGRMMGGHA